MIKNCEICGREYVAQRSTAKYCSNRCRLMAQRGVEYAGKLEAPNPQISMSQDEVLDVVQRAHGTASDLSRASLYTPAPLCVSLRSVAKKLEGALRAEGL